MNLLQFLNFRLFLLFFLFASKIVALDNFEFSENEKLWIKNNPKVVLGADYNWPPYDFLTDKKVHSGIAADYLKLISQKSGLLFEVKAGIWSEVMKKMKNSEFDGLACAVKTPQREKFLTFSKPYVSMPLAIIIKDGRNDIKSIKDLKGLKVTVNQGSYLHEWLVQNYPQIDLVLTTSNVKSLELVSFNKVDAYIGNIAVAMYIIKEKFLTNLKIINQLEGITTDTSIAIDKKNKILASIIEKSLAQITPEEHKAIRERWFNNTKRKRSYKGVGLTTQEKEWIQNHPSVKVGGGPDWAPFDFVSVDGKYTGLSKDYLDLVSKKTGLQFEVIVDKWSNNLEKMKTKELDLVHAVYYTDERKSFMDFTIPYFEMLDYFYIRDDLNVKTLKDLDGKRVAIPKGFAHLDILKKEFPLIKIVEVDTFSQAIDALIQRKADILFDTYASIEYTLKKDGINSIIPFKSYRAKNHLRLYMATAKGQPELLSILNKALKSITKNEKEKIRKRWFFNVLEERKKQTLNLSKKEMVWIKNHPEITYSEINWEPMSIIHNGSMIGIMNEYLKTITQKTGISFKYIKSSSWPEVIEKFKAGKIDVVPGIGESDYETQLGLTTDAYADFPFVLVTKTDKSFISDISELEGKTIAVPKFWTSYNYLKEEQANIKVVATKNVFEALDLVKDGKADAFLGHMAIGMHYVGTYYPKTLHIAGKVEYNFNHKILIQHDEKILLSILNKVFQSMPESEHLRIKNKWLHVKVNEAKDYTLFYQIGFVLLILIVGTMYWNRKLSNEILVRKKVEEDLKIQKDNFEILFEKVSDGNLIIQDKKFIACNDAALRMLGLSDKSELINSSPSRWSPPIQPDGSMSNEKVSLMMQICLENGRNRFEWVHIDKDGKEFWVDIGLTKIFYQNQDAIYAVWRDISEQKFLEQGLKEREYQMRTLIDNIPLHIMVSSYDGIVYLANKQTLHDYEIVERDLPFLNISEFYISLDERKEIFQELKTKGHVDKKIVQFKRPNGIYSMMMSLLPIKYEGKDMLLSIGVDLTERLEMEESLFKAKNIAEQANRSKSEFLANMSHEIRTPMNAIIGFTELLSEQLFEPRLKSYVKTIQTASSTLLTLINDILDLSKIEAGKLQINKTPTDVGKLCTEIASIFTMKIKEKGLDIFVNIDTNIPKSLLVDEIRLRQILLNLVGNAVKFTENGYIKLSVNALNIDDHLSKLDLEIIVEDTGLGIAPSQLEKIFKEFEQNEGQDNRKYGGTGLGLSISKRLSEMMDGDISVESKEGEGSKFRVKLTHIDISSVVSEKRVDKKVSKDVKSIVFKEAKILIIDDIEDNRELIIKNFEDTKIQVITAHNGLEAIERFKNEKPDLILMDIRMPVMDGYEAALKIKEISQVPIVALTASVMQDEAEQSKRENFDGFLRKPVLRYELFTELSKFLKYDLSQVSKNEEDLNIQMSEKAKTNLSNILQILSTDIKKLQLKALQTNNITEIKNLAFSIRSLAIEFDVEILDRYASKLYEATDAFDIEIIEQLINSYDDLVNKFTEL